MKRGEVLKTDELFTKFLNDIQTQVSQNAYTIWFSKLELLSIVNNVVTIKVPMEIHKQMLSDTYADIIDASFFAMTGINYTFKYITEDEVETFVEPVVEEQVEEKEIEWNTNLNPKFTFDNYVVGNSNRLAFVAARAVAEAPGTIHNPLFIYGGSGLGKTHLLYAICNEIKRNDPSLRILYTKGEIMTNELIEAIKNGTTAEFRTKYRQVDVLLVDDIQFISGKVSTQEEFFHTFDTLHSNSKQIVLTSDRPPREIATLEDRLRTRFEMGLLADIQPPDLETRIAIVKRKAQLLDFAVTDDIAEYLATQLKSNVRQLEGAVRRMQALCLIDGDHPSLIIAQTAIRDIRNDNQPVPITVERIINEVALSVTPEDIRSNKRSAPISQARQVAEYVVRNITGLPMKAIGEEFGTRDHSTVVYALQKVEQRMNQDPSFKGLVQDIIKNISEK